MCAFCIAAKANLLHSYRPRQSSLFIVFHQELAFLQPLVALFQLLVIFPLPKPFRLVIAYKLYKSFARLNFCNWVVDTN